MINQQLKAKCEAQRASPASRTLRSLRFYPTVFFFFLIFYFISVYAAAAAAAAAKSLQLCPTLCDPIDGSPPGSSVSGILQARILEWVAISLD